MTRVARRRLCAATLVVAFACRSVFPAWQPARSGRYDELPAEEWERFAAARADFDDGNLRLAREGFARLSERYPDHVPAAIWVQEVEFALAEDGAEDVWGAAAEEPSAAGAEEAPAERARIHYRMRADTSERAVDLLLAARVESDPYAALALLRRAVQVDDSCAWAHYGLAWWHARAREWVEARRALARALELAPGHIAARRLEAWLLARTGRLQVAAEALEEWLDHARGDVRVTATDLRDAEFEAALLAALRGESGRALRLLDEAAEDDGDPRGDDADRAAAFALRAAALREVGKPRAALEAARRAQEEDPRAVLPIVQEALLHELWLDEPVAALAAWERVIALVAREEAVASAVERSRASVHAERLRRRLGPTPAEREAP